MHRSANILQIDLEDEGAAAIAARSRGTPRVANRLLKRVRDFAEVRMEGVVSARAAAAALEMLEVDERGLDRLDREILRAICAKFDGGPVGLSTLAVAVGEEQDTIEDVYEPFLLQGGTDQADPAGTGRNLCGIRAPGTGSAIPGWTLAVLSRTRAMTTARRPQRHPTPSPPRLRTL